MRWRACGLVLLVWLGGIGSGCRRADFSGKVHLSFDDGANPEVTTALLATLAQYHISASFFEVGSHLAALPDHGRALLAAKRAGGHLIGNHSFTHPHFPQLSLEQIAQELDETESLLRDFTPLRLVRPPFGDDDARVRTIIRDLGYVRVKWDVQTADYAWEEAYEKGEPEVRERYIRSLVGKVKKKNGGILLLHDVDRITTDNLPLIIGALQSSGFSFVPLEYFLEVRH